MSQDAILRDDGDLAVREPNFNGDMLERNEWRGRENEGRVVTEGELVEKSIGNGFLLDRSSYLMWLMIVAKDE
jgi:hypothetical protein